MTQDWIDNKNKRYFLVFYNAIDKEGRRILGHVDFKTDGTYINQSHATEQIKSNSFIDVLITNIIELSEQDMKHFKS